MKTVLYTQRVEIVESYGERRDCADQNIPLFLKACGYLALPVPNIPETAGEAARLLKPAGLVLTGGNSLEKYGGNAPERDETERVLMELAVEQGIPVYGFCRGMQFILDYFGCALCEIGGHVAVRHRVSGGAGELVVNSYHGLGAKEEKEPLKALYRAEDGTIEAAACREKKILATMWHPEREKPFREEDIKRVKELFG